MTPEERTLLSDLFKRLREAESQPRDQDAERFIQQMVQSQPASSYYMAQSVLVQQQALSAAQTRIEELERQLKDAQSRAQAPQSSGGGSFLSNALGRGSPWGSRPEAPRAPDPAYNPVPPSGGARGPWGAPLQPPPGYGQSGGYAQPGYPPQPGYAPQAQASTPRGGFLSGAAQTAAGVAGGMLAANAISSLLHHSPGPFGSAMAAPADGPGETIINNYYGDSAGDPGGGGDQQGFLPDDAARDVDYQNDDPGLDDPGFDDGSGDDDNWV